MKLVHSWYPRAICAAFLLVAACDTKPQGTDPVTSSSASPQPSGAAASVTAKASAAPSGSMASASASSSASPPGAAEAWGGTYKSAAGSLTYAENYKEKQWQGDESPDGVGDGKMTLNLEAGTDRVTGTADGAIGDVLLVGTLSEGVLQAKVLRKNPTDNGFTGTASGKVNGASLEGEMRLSLAKANVIRKASFTLAKR